MHVAYIAADCGVPVFGRKGCSIHVQEILRAFARRGATVDLFAARTEGNPPGGLESVRVHQLTVEKSQADAEGRFDCRVRRGELLQRLQEAGPFDLVYERQSLWSFEGMAFSRRENIPGILEVNAPLIDEQIRHRSLQNRASAERAAVWMFDAASVLIAVSEGVADYLRRFSGARSRIHVVPNGVNPDRFKQPTISREKTGFTIGFVGTLKPWHGLDNLLAAFAMLHGTDPTVRLKIIGDGPERDRLETWLTREGDELRKAVEFTGAVSPDEVPQHLARVNAAVAPYPPSDPFYFSPLKVYEYMAAGLPVVASDIGQIGNVIDDGVNGLLCPPGDAVFLANALRRLREDRALCRRLGDAARATIQRGHTWDAVLDRILTLAEFPSRLVSDVEPAAPELLKVC